MMINENQVNSKLLLFMFEKMGGKDKVLKEFYGNRIREFLEHNYTISEISELSIKGGWGETWNQLPLADLLGMLSSKPRNSNQELRKTQTDRGELNDEIFNFLSSRRETGATHRTIKKELGIDPQILSIKLNYLRAQSRIESRKVKGKITYFIKT